MRLIESLKNRKYVLLNLFLILYICINLVGGERGLVSYINKKNVYEKMLINEKMLNYKLEDLENKISLVKKNDIDYLDMLYREKFKYGTKDEILIKIK